MAGVGREPKLVSMLLTDPPPADGCGGAMSDDRSSPASTRLRCGLCEDVIGVYEPLITLADGQSRLTSRAAEAHVGAHREPCFHRSCFGAAVTLLDRPGGSRYLSLSRPHIAAP
jgi:hypothetical protein